MVELGERSVDAVRLIVADELVGEQRVKATLFKERAVLVYSVAVAETCIRHECRVDLNGDLSQLHGRLCVLPTRKAVHGEVVTEGAGDSVACLLGCSVDGHGCLLGVGWWLMVGASVPPWDTHPEVGQAPI